MWLYSVAQWGIDPADRYVDDLVVRFAWLCNNPALWKPRTDLAEGLQSCPQQRHVIYFRAVGAPADTIEIVRVLHARMTPADHL
ncbi:type II toxin-antitoxin system RelE/ParE family toxin [uncultured Thiohalocapsa sp.]|uniref:type II toxin-antitoxin system RelE/ParE family toxin n=1 Tax=uncultured Thiohalocapsa sp. TaxID=768990 RepID=UPI0025FDDA90|nr:type II toxin-antitoxin system RelE/ParE family toxin [uncultured Thiohalocapsa sp.]